MSWSSGYGSISDRFSAMVLPVTVRQSPWMSPHQVTFSSMAQVLDPTEV